MKCWNAVMAFAKDYKEEIILAYYCFSLTLTITAFIFGTIYLRHRDRRDQQRREWRQFAERINSDYSKLKDKDIPRKISKVRDTFQNIQMKSSITGLDVLRYMLADANYEPNERSKTSQLESLRDDLQSIFQLFNVCSSLLLLGKIPKNIREELRDIVTELGKIAVPFFKGKRREIILKCLEHFGNGRPESETETSLRNVDATLKETVPYVESCLRFGRNKGNLPERPLPSIFDRYAGCAEFLQGGTPITDLVNRCDYSGCYNFSLNVEESSQTRNQDYLTFLKQLHADLSDSRYMPVFARKLQENPLPLIFDVKLNDDEQEPALVKVLHEVRFYIHLCLTNNLAEHDEVEQIKDNMTALEDVREEVTEVRPTEAKVKGISERFIGDLKRIQGSHYHCNNQNFCEKLEQLWEKLQEIQIIRKSSETAL